MEVRVLFRAQTEISMNKTIAIVNDPDVTLGTLPTSIIEVNAWEADWKKFDLNDNYIILGGHMGAYEDDKYEYLKKEKNWIKYAVECNTKILGICLGAQLIADSTGGEAYPSKEIEFGLKNLNFVKDDILVDVFRYDKVFTWHRDTFDLPEKAVLIANTNFPQIFKIHNSYGLQFHPEITMDLFTTWYSSDLSKKELSGFNVEVESSNLLKNSDKLKQVMQDFYSSWVNN